MDGLINCAGIIQPFVRIKDLEFDAIKRVMDVNLYGQIHMIKAFLPHLLARPEAHIVNISSMGGFFPVPGQTMYGASKAAVKLLTEGLYAEMIGTNVHVTVVFPGAIATNIAQNSGVVIAGLGNQQAHKFSATTAAVAAETIINGMVRNKFQVFIGQDARMMDLLSHFSLGRLSWFRVFAASGFRSPRLISPRRARRGRISGAAACWRPHGSCSRSCSARG